ncbi:hypothetical protein AVEN_118005-1 [Araneus ventricosus]|uniref:Uncharacterized protein n=1 Tax=Araneus ventricosus TaxID=182803 RepID=A0A4Y2C9D0_ARAVE|nr:hypothetical protein AVEN_118005-1 [Araneus ventricosus]
MERKEKEDGDDLWMLQHHQFLSLMAGKRSALFKLRANCKKWKKSPLFFSKWKRVFSPLMKLNEPYFRNGFAILNLGQIKAKPEMVSHFPNIYAILHQPPFYPENPLLGL